MKINKKRSYILTMLLSACLMIFAGIFLFFNFSQNVEASAVSFALPEDIESLFTDYTCTKLKDDTTLQDIEDLKLKYVDSSSTSYLERAEDVIKGRVKYHSLNEFSSSSNTIYQVGDVINKLSKFRLRYNTSDLITTGIYGKTNSTIKVFVECDTNYLPTLILTQQHGYYSGGYRRSFPLQKGLNVITYPDFVSSSSYIPHNEVKGGAIYLTNPYTHDTQGDIKVYIEGDGYYPVFDKTKNEKAFLGLLKEYEENRLKNPNDFLDLAELKTDHALITTTSSSLYDAYISSQSITPTENLTLWGDFVTNILEFNGFATSETSPNTNYEEINDFLIINFRYMSAVSNSGAYTADRHIGFYEEFAWFANFNYKKLQNIKYYNICHEIGHQIDVLNRKIDETTNNMTATYAYLYLLNLPATTSQQPFLRTLEKLYSDYAVDKNAFREGHILYPENDIRDRNYMVWWYLESIFPHFWAKLNNLYREDSAYNLYNINEKMVYYSSKIVNVDLTDYFDRFGLFMGESSYTKFDKSNTSSTFKTLMSEIPKSYDHFYLADIEEYDFIRVNSEEDTSYLNATPVIESVQKGDNGYTLTISNNRSKSHLGYEIYSSTDNEKFTLCGFTYSNSFLDDKNYNSSPIYYKALAVNRFFNITPLSLSATTSSEGEISPVCMVENEKFSTLEMAIKSVMNGGTHIGKTIYLLNDCYINDCTVYQALNIEVAKDVTRDITIFGGEKYMFRTNYIFNMTGRENARIIIDGGLLSRSEAAFYLGSGNCSLKYVIFKDCKANNLGGAIYQSMCNLTLSNCQFINCSSRGYDSAIYFSNTTKDDILEIENCTFKNNDLDIYFKYAAVMNFKDSVPNMSIFIENPNEKTEISCDFPLQEGLLQNLEVVNDLETFIEENKIILQKTNILLKFVLDGVTYEYSHNRREFVFGEEVLQNFDEKKYVFKYVDDETLAEHNLGDKITLSQNKTFNIETKDKFVVNLHLFSSIKTLYLKPDEEIYLTNLDGENKIISYSSSDKTYFTTTLYRATQNEDLYANYIDYFRVEFLANGVLQAIKYQTYGNQITTETCTLPGFKGWQADGNIVNAGTPYTVTKDVTLVALFNDDKTYNLNNATIEILDEDFSFTGSQIRPKIKVMIDGEELSSYYYSVEYYANTSVGVATIKILPLLDNVTGQKSTTFTITARQLTEADVNISNINNPTYDGTTKTINPTIIWNGKTLSGESDYSITYLDNQTNAGVVRFNISFKGNFSGTIEKSFTILQAEKPIVTSTSIYVDYEVNTLADIEPPENFVWVNENQEINSNEIFAYARYVGTDAHNYKTIDILFKITIEKKVTPPDIPDPPNPPDTPDDKPNKVSNSLLTIILLATIIPITIFAGIWIAVAVVRYNRKRKWKK